MKMQKSFLALVLISGLTVATQAYSETAINLQNPTQYCGQVSITYGPETDPTWDINNLLFSGSKPALQNIGSINSNGFSDYALGVVALQSVPCNNGAHFVGSIKCVLKATKLSDSFTVHMSTDSQGKLACTVD